MTSERDLPLFKAIRDREDPNLLRFWCPFCRCDHAHGSGADPKGRTEHRVAHCVQGPMMSGGYLIRIPRASAAEARVMAEETERKVRRARSTPRARDTIPSRS